MTDVSVVEEARQRAEAWMAPSLRTATEEGRIPYATVDALARDVLSLAAELDNRERQLLGRKIQMHEYRQENEFMKNERERLKTELAVSRRQTETTEQQRDAAIERLRGEHPGHRQMGEWVNLRDRCTTCAFLWDYGQAAVGSAQPADGRTWHASLNEDDLAVMEIDHDD